MSYTLCKLSTILDTISLTICSKLFCFDLWLNLIEPEFIIKKTSTSYWSFMAHYFVPYAFTSGWTTPAISFYRLCFRDTSNLFYFPCYVFVSFIAKISLQPKAFSSHRPLSRFIYTIHASSVYYTITFLPYSDTVMSSLYCVLDFFVRLICFLPNINFVFTHVSKFIYKDK